MAEEIKDQEKELRLQKLKEAREAIKKSTSYTLEDVEEQEKEEEKSRSGFIKIPYFKMGKSGKYSIRMLPLKPTLGLSEEEEKSELEAGWSIPIRKVNMNIMRSGGKMAFVSAIQPSFAGIDGDIVRIFRKLVLSKSAEDNRPELKDEIDHHERGVKYKSRKLAYILDTDDRTEGDGDKAKPKIQSWELSFTQASQIQEQNKIVWEENTKSGEPNLCPITRDEDACNVVISKKGKGLDTAYTFTLSRKNDDTLSDDEILAWLEMPSLKDHFYVYTRYQFEATLAFLEQWELDNDVSITTLPEFISEKEKIESQLPTTDKSHFDISSSNASANDDSKDSEVTKVTLDSLYDALDHIEKEGIDAKNSDEAGALRTQIQQFINENELGDMVIMSPVKSNATLVDEIVDAIEEAQQATRTQNEKKESRRRR